MSKHTPGPWAIHWGIAQGGEAHHIVDSRDMAELSIIATVHFHEDHEGETKANALLIAASRELLSSAKAVVEILRGWPMPGMQREFNALCDAIDKAAGD